MLQNQFDSIDLSDNSIVRLEGFPKLPRLQCLHLSNNRINRIARNLEGEPAPLGPGRQAGRQKRQRNPGEQLHSRAEAWMLPHCSLESRAGGSRSARL